MEQGSRSLRLAFAGTPQFAVPALEQLSATGHRICAVFTQADRAAGRGRALRASPVKQRALELGLAVHQPVTFRSAEARELLAALAVDAFIVVAYGLILPADTLAVPRFGCLNIHASLLPRWRGAAPIQRAILAGDAASGISIMMMEEQLDTGPVLAARSLGITPQDTAQSLSERLAQLGATMICETLDELGRGPVARTAQDERGITYAAKIRKSEALIDWRDRAEEIARAVRAFNPWPIAETRFEGRQLRIWEAEAASLADAPQPSAPGTVLRASPAGIEVACGEGVLRIRRLQSPGKNVVEAQQFAQSAQLQGAQFLSS